MIYNIIYIITKGIYPIRVLTVTHSIMTYVIIELSVGMYFF